MKTPEDKLDPLIKRATAGDKAALESLLLHFHDPLLHFIRARRLRYNITAIGDEDVLQETLLEAFHHIRSLEPQGSAAFCAWLKVIARTRMINIVKAQKAQKRGRLVKHVHEPVSDVTVTALINQIAGDQPTPSRIIRKKELMQEIAREVAELNTNQRRVMELRFGRGLSVEQIGAQLGLAEGAVKMHINRSLKELREVFAKHSMSWVDSM